MDMNQCQCAMAGTRDLIYMKQVVSKMRESPAIFRWKL